MDREPASSIRPADLLRAETARAMMRAVADRWARSARRGSPFQTTEEVSNVSQEAQRLEGRSGGEEGQAQRPYDPHREGEVAVRQGDARTRHCGGVVVEQGCGAVWTEEGRGVRRRPREVVGAGDEALPRWEEHQAAGRLTHGHS